MEDFVLKKTAQYALERFSEPLDWQPHVLVKYPDPPVAPTVPSLGNGGEAASATDTQRVRWSI